MPHQIFHLDSPDGPPCEAQQGTLFFALRAVVGHPCGLVRTPDGRVTLSIRSGEGPDVRRVLARHGFSAH